MNIEARPNPIRFVLLHREMISRAVSADVRKRYAGSILGRGWLVFSPVLLLAVYTIVYVFIFRLRPIGMELPEYILHIFAGLVTYLGLSEGISAGMVAVLSNRSVLRGTAFPAALIPVKAVISSQVGYLIGMGILLVASTLIGTLSWRILLLPYVMLVQILFLIGLAWFTSLLNVVIRDLQHAITYILMVLMVLSPIAYTLDMVPQGVRLAVLVNPFAHFIFMSQNALSSAADMHWEAFAVCAAMTLLVVMYGFRFFENIKAIVTEYA